MIPPSTLPDAADRAALHEHVCEVARRAGELALSRYDDPGNIREKAPKDFVTEVDLLCEDLMVRAIEERYPEDAILSEERGGGISPTGRTWLLDPIDGTANFARANPLFCVCVSVLEGPHVTHAAVAAPRLGDLYHAWAGGGAWRDHDGTRSPMRVNEAQEIGDAFVGVDLSLYGGKKMDPKVQEVLSGAWQLRSLGSAGIRGAWTAAGYVDVSVGTRNTAWDYAPTVLLVVEAGGRATDLDGRPWTPDAAGLVAANPALHGRVLGMING